ncbi:hypothetical protein FSP39_023389 [Pinctada imbricata]|uniref:B box-type domain-containing protein n=1 Tax=Pinctada imbricata TaxID=66713 RepID=A0AA88XY39_PINIB|nr:hypothetical protein FSP39_023389 [Pinctada imbricata]
MMSDEEVMDQYPTQHVVECEDCGEQGDIPWYCKNCPGSLCDKCKEAHQRSGILKKHSIVPRSSVVLRTYGPAKIAEMCKTHPEKDISTYCNDCKVPCCASCLVEKHQRHSFSLIEDEYLAAETRLNDHIKDLENNALGKLADRRTKFQVKITKSEERTAELKKEISNFETEVILAVRNSFDGFRERANISTDNFVKNIHDTDAAMEKVKKEIEDCEKRIRIGKLDIIEYFPALSDSHIPEV